MKMNILSAVFLKVSRGQIRSWVETVILPDFYRVFIYLSWTTSARGGIRYHSQSDSLLQDLHVQDVVLSCLSDCLQI
jgi:hypothetical protein